MILAVVDGILKEMAFFTFDLEPKISLCHGSPESVPRQDSIKPFAAGAFRIAHTWGMLCLIRFVFIFFSIIEILLPRV